MREGVEVVPDAPLSKGEQDGWGGERDGGSGALGDQELCGGLLEEAPGVGAED